ncbi:hypothetical protein B0A48_17261 [Cryoendolithus antarcticus]|uniref:D-aminoacyl-tRNA deacylase n=1 Tax=Cryoendolithus antarcticus TaxID=1507870 RepID=A0A1V8SDB3_9PEZI|nr:hypothetical protein B0A48_17261 [Cryoendolithus antarcticus]
MKTIIQRVKSASVTVDGQSVSSISRGLLIFAAIGKEDTPKTCESMASKVLKVKLWDSEDGKKWKRSVQDIEGEVLCVSQFTLLASVKKGNRPDFHKSALPKEARELYDSFIGCVRTLYQAERVKDGIFGAMMDVALVNDGPVTIEIDSNPPPMENVSGLPESEFEGEFFKGHLSKTFDVPVRTAYELPASLLE